jgi:exodeoxyribonuclease-3
MKLRLISWNVNGIRAVHKKGLFVPFISEYKPDMLCLQETKAQREQSTHQGEVDLVDYEEYWNSAVRKGYSGTAIVTKHKPLSIALGFPAAIEKKYTLADEYGDPNTEGRVIAAEFEQFFLVTCYTPNSKPDLSRLSLRHKEWDPAFLDYMKQLEKKKPVIFCGDLNVAHTELDLANPDINHHTHGFTDEERAGIDAIIKAGFVDTFRLFTKDGGHYSWWSAFNRARDRNIGWRIDYFFVSASLKDRVTAATILDTVYGSDHCPVLIEVNL